MSDTQRGLPAWLWGVAAVALAVGAGLLALRGRQPEPGEALRYDVAAVEAKGAGAPVLFEERAMIDPGIEGVTALAVGPEGEICTAGEGGVCVRKPMGAEPLRIAMDPPPRCLAVTSGGRILAGRGGAILVFGPGGAEQARWTGFGEKAHITALAVDGEEVFAADAGQRVVLRLDARGQVLNRIGAKDEAQGIAGFIIPSGYFDVAFDPMGGLWAVNPGRHGLEQYRPDGSLVSAWQRASMKPDGFCGCCNPTHIAFLDDNTLVTAEKGVPRVKLYAPDHELLGFVAPPAAFAEPGSQALALDKGPPVRGLAVDAAGRVLVLDGWRDAIRVFVRKEPES